MGSRNLCVISYRQVCGLVFTKRVHTVVELARSILRCQNRSIRFVTSSQTLLLKAGQAQDRSNGI